MTTVVRSDDISCGGCIASIVKALTALPGVKRVSGDPETKVVTVEHEFSVSAKDILSSMDAAGFTGEVVA